MTLETMSQTTSVEAKTHNLEAFAEARAIQEPQSKQEANC